jgi:hypothetical protein
VAALAKDKAKAAQRASKTIEAKAAPKAAPEPATPKLIEEPILKRSGMNPSPEAK